MTPADLLNLLLALLFGAVSLFVAFVWPGPAREPAGTFDAHADTACALTEPEKES